MSITPLPFISIFTYGTLMTGYNNHHYLSDYKPAEGILYGYRRIWPQCESYPVIEAEKGGVVVGEFYKFVTKETKEMIDRLESVPNLYVPIRCWVKVDGKGKLAITYYPTPSLLEEWKKAEERCGQRD